jgi:hypothetical protein
VVDSLRASFKAYLYCPGTRQVKFEASFHLQVFPPLLCIKESKKRKGTDRRRRVED